MKPSEVLMTWQEVLERKELQDLPYKMELKFYGKLELTPITNVQGMLKSEIGYLLSKLLKHGHCLNSCSIQTQQNVKVADVAWASQRFLDKYLEIDPFPVAPEICVEIISPSNSTKEILEKIGLYIAAGAFEVWTCNLEGEMRFYDAEGAVLQSNRVPEFPKIVTW
jgi:Uma2 family endonuclease